MATSTLPTGISGINPTGENTSIVGFVLGISEDTPFHPIRPLVVASFAVFTLCGFEVAQVLKDKDSSSVPLGKVDDAVTHQMCYLLINIA
jgi:hypothetical protein